MLHIVLLILKIIGILLGALFGILLLGLCLALFVPLRYQFQAKRTEKEGNPPVEVRAKFTWLFHLLNVKIHYPADVYVRARIFFFTVFRMPGKQKKVKSPNKRKWRNQKPEKRKPQEQKPQEQKQEKQVETPQKEEIAESIDHTGKKEADKAESDVPAREETQKNKRLIDRIRAFFHSIKEKIIKMGRFFQNIWYTIKRICDKIRAIWENIDYYLNIVKSDTFKRSYALCKDEFGTVFSYIKPRKMAVDLVIGTGDPASTATIFSYYGMLYPVVGNFVTVTPDFDEKRIEGTVFIRGKVKLFTILKVAVRIYFNKDIRKLYKLFKKEDV